MTVDVIVQLETIDRAANDRKYLRIGGYHRGPNPMPRKNGTGASYG